VIRNRVFAARHRRLGQPRAIRGVAAALTFMLLATFAVATRDSALAQTDKPEQPVGAVVASGGTSGLPHPNLVNCSPDEPECNWPPDDEPPWDSPQPRPMGCVPTVHREVMRLTIPASQVRFYGGESCYNFSPQISAVTYLLDRTPGHDGNYLSPQIYASGTREVFTASTPIDLPDANYPAATKAEVVLETVMVAPPGIIWTQCSPLTGLRYVRPCQGLGTDTLRSWIGTGTFDTKVQHPPEVCKTDDTPFAIGTMITVIPHIRYCGYFDMGANSRVTRVEKVRQTEILPNSLLVCDANFFPNPPALDGTPTSDGLYGRFEVTVRVMEGACDAGGVGRYIYIKRTYLPNGQVQNLDRVTT
jgi:hypothetical protein